LTKVAAELAAWPREFNRRALANTLFLKNTTLSFAQNLRTIPASVEEQSLKLSI